MKVKVNTQAQLDEALANPSASIIEIGTSEDWLRVSKHHSATVHANDLATVHVNGSATVYAYDSATVRAYVSATVHANDSATVHANDSATVHANDSATVNAYDSATVHAYGSATVRASDSATVHVNDSATVHAYDSATVRASDSATVHAYDWATVHANDSATVHAYNSATVHANDSATIHAYDSATVHALRHVAIHLHSGLATVSGGVVIDLTGLDLTTSAEWVAYRGVSVTDESVILYKAANPLLETGHVYGRTTTWTVGTTVAAPDWDPADRCGGGLHLSPSPHHAKGYRPDGEATRYLRVQAKISDLVVLGDDKCKAPEVTVLAEVDVFGKDLRAR